MLKVALAKKTGFCFGVKRAVNMAETALRKEKPIHSLGSIIHNKQVVERLGAKGLKVIKDAGKLKGGTVVISSHGLSPKIKRNIVKRGANIIDTTCPFVLNAQKIAKRLSDEGYTVIVVGDVNHPEVRALVDFAPGRALVVKDKLSAKKLRLKKDSKLGIISQTTQSVDNFLDVVTAVLDNEPKELRVFNTICKDAHDRQRHASELTRRVDVMLVIGGRDSANTKRLFQVCRKILGRSYLIETEEDLDRKWFKGRKAVGITSGASTPDWIIKKVVNKIENAGRHKKGVVH